jgi:biotin carboxyl carrier protein
VRIEVLSAGRQRRFDVSRMAAGWRVESGGRARRASLVRVGSRWSLLVGGDNPEDGARSYEVVFEGRQVYVNGRAVATQIVRPATDRNVSGVPNAGAGHTVSSPMPGRVVRVLVGPGDVVADRQSLVVVEAMKMENELRAPRAGVVAEVRAVEGMPVETRTVLVVLE